jgi:hypothetical protein
MRWWDKSRNLFDWHRWFAWYPVKTTVWWVWFEVVERKLEWLPVHDEWGPTQRWHYREVRT